MRRHLVLVRHAKSSWDDPSLVDHDRPLAARGIKALPRLSDHLAAANDPPELVLCSTARRALDTLDGIRGALPPTVPVETERGLYGATAGSLLGRLHDVDGSIGCVMVIGHNPTMQDVAVELAGTGDAERRARLATKLPTGAAVTLSFDGGWNDLTAGAAQLDELFVPRRPSG